MSRRFGEERAKRAAESSAGRASGRMVAGRWILSGSSGLGPRKPPVSNVRGVQCQVGYRTRGKSGCRGPGGKGATSQGPGSVVVAALVGAGARAIMRGH